MSPDVGKPGEGESKFNELLEEIRAFGTKYDATIEAEGPDEIIDSKPVLEAIFCKRYKNELTDQEALVLAKVWIKQINDRGGKIFLISNLAHLKTIGLFKNQSEIDEIVNSLELSKEDQGVMKDELAQLLGTPSFTTAWNPPFMQPEPTRTDTIPGHPGEFVKSPKPAPADTDTEEHDPRGFVQKHARSIGMGIATAAALALGTSSFSLWKGSEDNPASPPAAAASEIAGSPEPTPPKAKTASLAPTPTSTPSTPPAPVQKAPVAKAPTKPATAPISPPAAPVVPVKPEPAAVPEAPEPVPIEAPKIANFPIVTRQNALGATFIDVEASRPKWAADGWKIESFISPDGNRGVKLVKNGRTATINNLRIAAGIEVLGLNVD